MKLSDKSFDYSDLKFLGSKEKLVSSKEPSLDANKAACSPPCLRPPKKIEDVTTIKRVHKGPWL